MARNMDKRLLLEEWEVIGATFQTFLKLITALTEAMFYQQASEAEGTIKPLEKLLSIMKFLHVLTFDKLSSF